MKKGFTLIELLVVIAIIGIISSIALVNLNSARQSARKASTEETFSNLVRVAQLCQDEYDGSGTIGELNCTGPGSDTICGIGGPPSRLIEAGTDICLGDPSIGTWPTLEDGWIYGRTNTPVDIAYSDAANGQFRFMACTGTGVTCTGTETIICTEEGCTST
jgi:prepilin-type N-terminal cleavage/methylation domain-containing protein